MWKSQRELTGFNVALMLWREYVPKEKCSLNADHITSAPRNGTPCVPEQQQGTLVVEQFRMRTRIGFL
jgi:hypothetical protein